MTRRSHYMTRDRWTTRAVEALEFGLCGVFHFGTLWVPTRWLTGTLAPLGGWLALMLPGLRRRAKENLSRVWPEMTATRQSEIIRGAGQNFMRLMVEYSRFRRFAGEVEVVAEGTDHLRAAAETGKGTVILSAHFGNWEGIRLAARQVGVNCGILRRHFNNRYLDRYTQNLITAAGDPILIKGRAGVRQLMAHVARGGTVLILVDQRNTGAPLIPFLGHPAETMLTAAEIARRAGATILTARSIRNLAEQRLEVVFEGPIQAEAPLDVMAEANDRISAWIRSEPEQWLWLQRRWKQKRL
ncbi:MAG: hypothetical protein AAF713_15715 [Pseudomonadota bacterium]